MAEELGAAVLRVTVDTREALAVLGKFRTDVANSLKDVGKVDFGNVDFSKFVQQAAQAGAQAGKAFSAGIEASTKSTKQLKFLSFQQALDFTPKNTIKGLEEYARALQKLRDATSLSAKGTQQLTDRLGAIQAALAQARATTAQATATQREFNESLEKTRLKRVADEVRLNAAADREWAAALKTIDSAQRAAAAASRETTQAIEAQRRAYLDLAKAGIGAVGGIASGAAGAASALGKGAIGAVRTGVKVGRAAYGVGAELGIFEDPKPGVVNAAIQSVIDRFAFLGKQAQTTRGIVLRTLEAVPTGAGLIELARNADLLRESLKAVSVTAKATDASVSAFAKFGNYFANSGLGSIGPLKDLFKGFADLETGTAAITSFSDQLIQIGTKGLSGSVDAIEALVNGFGQLPPAAQAAALAAPAVFAVIAGPAGKQAEVQLRKLKALLDGLGTTSLNVEGQLRDALNAIAEQEGILRRAPLALPSSDLLQQRLRDSGSRQPQRLEPGVLNAVNNAGLGIAEQYTRQLEAAARAVKSQRDQYIAVQAEASKLLETDLRRQQILNSIARQRAAGPGFGAASAANFGQVDPVEKAIRRNREAVAQAEERAQKRRDLLAQDLGDVQARRVAVQKSILKLEEAEREATSRRAKAALEDLRSAAQAAQQRQDAIRQLRDATAVSTGRASPIDGRLPNDLFGRERFVPGSPAERARRRKQREEAGSNALIGGAFPLLFGQGIGASIGGAAGGGLGGFAGGQLGFGLSLLGTAVGAQFDLATQKAGTLAAALKDPIGRFSELQEAGLLSSKGLERQVEALISTGRAAEAAALIQQDLASTYGTLGNAKALADQSDQLGRSWSQLTIVLADLSVAPVADLLKSTAEGLRGFAEAIAALRDVLPNPGNLPAPLKALRDSVQQDLLTGSLPLGLGQFARIARLGKGFQGLFGGGGSSGAGAQSPQVQEAAAAQKELVRLAQQQAVAEAQGNRALAVGTQLTAARVKLQQDLAALSKEDREGPKGQQLQQQYNQLVTAAVEQQKAAADASERQLATTRKLVGLEGTALTIRQEQLKIAEARRVADQAANAVTKLEKTPGTSPEALTAARDVARQTSAEYQRITLEAKNASELALRGAERELASARQLLGLEGERLTIKQEQQKVDEAQRQFAQADSTFRQRFGGVDPRALVGAERDEFTALYNLRAAAENNLTRIRLSSYEQIQRAEERLADQRRAVEERIKNARAGAGLTSLGRNVLAEQSQFRQQQIDAQRLNQRSQADPTNGALAEQAKDARRSLVAAGEELRLKLQDAFESAKAAVRSITRSIEDGRLALISTRGGAGGVNKFIDPQQALNRQQAANALLFREASRLAERAGVNATFTGTLTERNDQISEFIQALRSELRGTEDLNLLQADLSKATSDLAVSTEALVNVNTALVTQIEKLAGKNWAVNVNVPGGTASGDLIGSINGGF